MTETFRRPPLQAPERPDTLFGLVAGLYVAALVSPALLAAVAVWVSSDAGVLYVGLLAIVTAVTVVVAWGVGRWRGIAERLGTTRLAWLLPLLGLVATAGYFAFATIVLGASASGVGIAGFFTGMFAFLLGIGLLTMSRSRYTAAVVDEDAVELEWRAAWPDRLRTRVFGVAALLVVLGVVSFGLTVWNAVQWDVNLFAIATGIAAVLVSLGSERTYRVTPHGLERSYPVARRFYPWGAFTGVCVTAEAIVLRRPQPWRLDIQCAREDVDEVDTVVDSLERHLERLD